MKTLLLLPFFFMPALACETSTSECTLTKPAAKTPPALHASVTPAAPAPTTTPAAKPPRREVSTPRPKYLFM